MLTVLDLWPWKRWSSIFHHIPLTSATIAHQNQIPTISEMGIISPHTKSPSQVSVDLKNLFTGCDSGK